MQHWVADKDVSVLHSLCFVGTSFELSQSHPSFVACPEDPGLLAVPGYTDLVLITGLPFDFMILTGWASSFLSFIFLRPIPLWVLGFKSF